MNFNVTICGGGNLGLVCAGVLASRGYVVSILSGHPDNWSRCVEVSDPDGKVYAGELARVSADPAEVIPGADIVFLCLPGNLIEPTLRRVAPHLDPVTIVGSIVSSTGFFRFSDEVIPGRGLFGFQRTPYIARTREYGRSASLLGYKPVVNVALENIADPEALRRRLEDMFMTPVSLLESRFETALTNSNPILHTGRLYSMWGKQVPAPVAEAPMFYADWTDDASQTILDMDAEFMTLLRTLGVRKGAVLPLTEYYESANAAELTRKIRSIAAFKSIASPMILTPEGWVPDYSSRYFTEDFAFGLRFIRELAERHGVDAPTIEKVYAWGVAFFAKNA